MAARTFLIGASALSLAACGSAPDRDAAVNAAPADDYATRIRALPEGQRDAVLLRAIRDAGRDCQHVTQSTAVAGTGPSSGEAPAWSARCDDGAIWVVALNPGGVATVTGAAAQR